MRLHLVDGTFELFRAHYAKRPGHETPEGKPFKATAGLISSLLWLLSDPNEKVTHIAVAFDQPIRSFRNDLFAGYKTDAGVEPELLAQFDDAIAATRALGLVAWPMDQWEADDALATAATKFAPHVEQVRILTPDKDLGQCLEGTHIVQVDRIRDRLIDEAAMREQRGVAPESIPDLLALIGDDADGIPGLAGFGAKGAATLLSQFTHIENIPDNPKFWNGIRGAERLANTLRAERENALLYRQLATLVRDVPLKESLEDLKVRAIPASFAAWCQRCDTPRLLERANKLVIA